MEKRRKQAVQNKDKAYRLNKDWGVGAVQARYNHDGHWYGRLDRFPGAFFDREGYILFATEKEYLAAGLSIGKQVSVKPNISALPGYVQVVSSDPATTDPEDAVSRAEGRELLQLHRTRERDSELVTRKKRRVLAETDRLECESCGFDFAAVYGQLGIGFAECHHTQPLAQAGERVTTLADLAVVCANCHRMLHRRPWRTVGELRELLLSRR